MAHDVQLLLCLLLQVILQHLQQRLLLDHLLLRLRLSDFTFQRIILPSLMPVLPQLMPVLLLLMVENEEEHEVMILLRARTRILCAQIP